MDCGAAFWQGNLIGQRHFFRNSNPKRKRGNELGTIPRSRFGLQKRSVSAKTGAVQLILSREKNGSVSVGLNIDKSIRAENYLEGIRNGATGDVFNFNTGPMYQSENWHLVSLRFRGPKELADPMDVRRPSFSGHSRPCNSRHEYDESPTSKTARLTLSSTLSSGREAYVQLIAGTTLHLGRANTWDSSKHHEYVPNDIVLTTLAPDEYDDFVSRYHGRICLERGSLFLCCDSLVHRRRWRRHRLAFGALDFDLTGKTV